MLSGPQRLGGERHPTRGQREGEHAGHLALVKRRPRRRERLAALETAQPDTIVVPLWEQVTAPAARAVPEPDHAEPPFPSPIKGEGVLSVGPSELGSG